MSETKIKIRITNSSSNELSFHLEPWGDQYLIPQGSFLMVDANGPEGGTLEVEYRQDGMTVYGWVGSVCEVKQD